MKGKLPHVLVTREFQYCNLRWVDAHACCGSVGIYPFCLHLQVMVRESCGTDGDTIYGDASKVTALRLVIYCPTFADITSDNVILWHSPAM